MEEMQQHPDPDSQRGADEDQIKAVFEGALDGVLIADDEGRYVAANAAAAALFGMSRAELTGHRIDELIDPAGRAAVEERWRTFLSRDVGTGEYELRCHDGTLRTIEYYARRNIAPGRHLCMVRDVTERRRVHDVARESDVPLQLALDGASVCAWEWDIASDRIAWWGSVEPLVDVGEGPASVRAFLELVQPEDRAGVIAAVAAALERGVPIDAEFRIRRVDGTHRWLLAKGHVLHDATGAAVHVVGVALDIDRRKRAAEEQVRIKDEFLAMVSHELRGPLQTTIMWAHVLGKENADEASRLRACAGIQQSVGLQRRLIDDLVDVSRIVAGKLTLDFQSVEPAAVVESVVEIIGPAAELKGVALEVELQRGGRVAADPDRLQQVVWNLVSNAVKFTPAGGRVAVRVRGRDRQLEIVVADTGDGIAPELLSHVFEPFRQADELRGGSRAGLGLGLTIVRHLVERHGGAVHAESPGIARGATFTVRLPRSDPPPAADAARR